MCVCMNDSDVVKPVFYIGDRTVEEVANYTYLGINIHKSGKFKIAEEKIYEKAMNALFKLKFIVWFWSQYENLSQII